MKNLKKVVRVMYDRMVIMLSYITLTLAAGLPSR